MHSVSDATRLILGAVDPRVSKTPTPTSSRGDFSGAITGGGRPDPVMTAVAAERPLPPFDRVAMDGIAICLQAVGHDQPAIDGERHFVKEGLQPAGAEPLTLNDKVRGCIEVMTGAMLPHGCDTVINYERLEATATGFTYRQGDQLHEFSVGDNVHHKGSDYPEGHPLITEGALATGPVLGLMASEGHMSYDIPFRPRIALIATGDELVSLSQKPAPHQIRRSNTYAIDQLLSAYGFDRIEHHYLPDDRDAVASFLTDKRDSEEPADVLIFSGGVSKGKKDYIPEVVSQLGGEVLVHGVSQRPGKPLFFAKAEPNTGTAEYIFGLPGNPVSTLVCALRYVIPALRRLNGVGRWPGLWGAPVRLGADFRFGKPLTRFAPVTLKVTEDATLVATPIAIGGSGDYGSLIPSDGVIELPAEPAEFAAGGIYPYYGWLPLTLGPVPGFRLSQCPSTGGGAR